MINININNYLQDTSNLKTRNTTNENYSNVEIIEQSDVGVLDQNSFLKMMLTQLQNQDPLSPMDTNNFSTQMAQFAMVEQLTNIGSKIDSLTDLILLGMLPELDTEGNSSNEDQKVDSDSSNEEETLDTDTNSSTKEYSIREELENLKSVTLHTNFDYSTDEIYDLNSKLSNLILRSNFN